MTAREVRRSRQRIHSPLTRSPTWLVMLAYVGSSHIHILKHEAHHLGKVYCGTSMRLEDPKIKFARDEGCVIVRFPSEEHNAAIHRTHWLLGSVTDSINNEFRLRVSTSSLLVGTSYFTVHDHKWAPLLLGDQRPDHRAFNSTMHRHHPTLAALFHPMHQSNASQRIPKTLTY
jgi:hypothetical protein